MKLHVSENGKLVTVIRKMLELLEYSGYINVKYESSDMQAHYFHFESIEDNGVIEIWDLQVELEGDYEINSKPPGCEDWYYVGETFQEILNCYNETLELVI